MANLTLTIDDDVLKRARMRAIEQGTSVNAVVREHLEAYAGGAPAREAIVRFLEIADTASGSSGGRRWTRDELHER